MAFILFILHWQIECFLGSPLHIELLQLTEQTGGFERLLRFFSVDGIVLISTELLGVFGEFALVAVRAVGLCSIRESLLGVFRFLILPIVKFNMHIQRLIS